MAVLLAMFVVWLVGDVLLLIFAAALFALGLRGLVDILSRAVGVRIGSALDVVARIGLVALEPWPG
jgi:hypothetical protein